MGLPFPTLPLLRVEVYSRPSRLRILGPSCPGPRLIRKAKVPCKVGQVIEHRSHSDKGDTVLGPSSCGLVHKDGSEGRDTL